MDSPASACPELIASFATDYSTLLESLYAGILSHRGFAHFLQGLQHCFDSCSVVLVPIDRALPVQWGWTAGVEAGFVQWCRDNDMVANDADINKLAQAGLMAEGFVSMSPLFNNDDLVVGVAGNLKPWIQKKSIIDSAGLVIPAPGGRGYLLLALQRDKSGGKFDDTDIERMNLLVPHLRQAMELFTRICPPTKIPLSVERIQQYFKLTPTEALVSMMLAEDISLKEIARHRNVSVYTVREQIRLVFKKTGCSCQRELVAAILRMSLVHRL